MNCSICNTVVNNFKNISKHQSTDKCKFIKSLLDKNELKHINKTKLLNDSIKNLEEQNKLLINQNTHLLNKISHLEHENENLNKVLNDFNNKNISLLSTENYTKIDNEKK